MDPLSSLLTNINTAASQFSPAVTTIPFDASSYATTDFNTLLKQAYEELKPYYTKLLQDAQGDLNLAKSRLEEDYQTGKRYSVEDFTTSMRQLGLTFPQEQTALSDTLNKRGIALTQTTPGSSATTYAGGGQAGTELGSLNEDQALRKEAVQRTQDRTNAQLIQTKTRGTEDVTRQAQIYGEGLQQQLESQATQRAGLRQQQQQQANQASLQGKINQAQLPGGTGTSTVNPNDAASIKSGFPGYTGWNNPQAIIDDFRATGGRGKT